MSYPYTPLLRSHQYAMFLSTIGYSARARVVARDLRPRVLRNSHATWLLNMGIKVEFIIGTVSRRLREGYALGVGWMEPRMFFEHYARILRRAKREEIIKAQESFRELSLVNTEYQ